jgi:hypothetical protein
MIPYLGDWQAPKSEPHVYPHNGQFLPSVTTILDRTVNKYFLERWKDAKRKEYFLYHWTDGINIADLWEDSKKHPLWLSLDAAAWGTAMHSAMQELLEGEESPLFLDDTMEKGCRKAYGILKQFNCKVIQIEEKIYSDKFAGTMDLLCEIDDNMFLTKPLRKVTSDRVVALIDFKSSKGQYYKSHKIQLAGYSQCELPSKPHRFAIMRIERAEPKVNFKAFDMEHWLECWDVYLKEYLLNI